MRHLLLPRKRWWIYRPIKASLLGFLMWNWVSLILVAVASTKFCLCFFVSKILSSLSSSIQRSTNVYNVCISLIYSPWGTVPCGVWRYLLPMVYGSCFILVNIWPLFLASQLEIVYNKWRLNIEIFTKINSLLLVLSSSYGNIYCCYFTSLFSF